MCFESIVAGLSVRTTLRDLQLAARHDHEDEFTSRMLDFALAHSSTVVHSPEWSSFVRDNPEVAAEFTRRLC